MICQVSPVGSAATSVLLMVATLCCTAPSGLAQNPSENVVRLKVQTDQGERLLQGRIRVEAQDGGVLLEDSCSRLRILPAGQILSREDTQTPFALLNSGELGADLLRQVPDGFEILETEHYVVCSDSSEDYAKFCGRLLERVYDKYFDFMKSNEIPVVEPSVRLPVLIFATETEFQAFAKQQHPETSFADTPGYYSLKENQTLLTDLTRDRSVRAPEAIRRLLSQQPLQVATMVHEAVHQLAFNSGLQVRMADNPVWFSEGLALYFEPIAPKSATLWTGPGSVNGRHRPVFVKACETGVPTIGFSSLISGDSSFTSQESVATAYAESWALTSFLFQKQKTGMQKFLANLAERKPLRQLSADERLLEFQQCFGKSPDEFHGDAISFIQRMRVPGNSGR